MGREGSSGVCLHLGVVGKVQAAPLSLFSAPYSSHSHLKPHLGMYLSFSY